MDADANADANTDANARGSTIPLPGCCSGELKKIVPSQQGGVGCLIFEQQILGEVPGIRNSPMCNYVVQALTFYQHFFQKGLRCLFKALWVILPNLV